jgi:hypothetical protein
MQPEDWENVGKYFQKNSSYDFWGNADALDYGIVYGLYNLRVYTKKPIYVHCGCEPRLAGGWHPKGLAVDIHIEGMSLIDQFIVASRFPVFRGIGVYPWWNNPGLHLDRRTYNPQGPRALWISTGNHVYREFDEQNLIKNVH